VVVEGSGDGSVVPLPVVPLSGAGAVRVGARVALLVLLVLLVILARRAVAKSPTDLRRRLRNRDGRDQHGTGKEQGELTHVLYSCILT
jgi:hypothetical protein